MSAKKTTMPTKTRKIAILGAVHVDEVSFSTADGKVHRIRRDGGALLLADMVRASLCTAFKDVDFEVIDCRGNVTELAAIRKSILENIKHCPTTSATLQRFPKFIGKKEPLVYRLDRRPHWGRITQSRDVKAKALGLGHGARRQKNGQLKKEKVDIVGVWGDGALPDADKTIKFLRLYEGKLVWQMKPRREHSEPSSDPVLSCVLGSGDLASHTTITVTSHDLNQAGITIRENTSVETLAREFVRSLSTSQVLRTLSRCGHLVVWFKEGALYLPNGGTALHLVWCPNAYVGDPSPEIGNMSAYSTLRTACLIKGVAAAEFGGRTLGEGVMSGVRLGTVLAARHFRDGFAPGNLSDEKFKDHYPFKELLEWCETSPNDAPYDTEKENEFWLAALEVPLGAEELSSWSRISQFYEHKAREKRKKDGSREAIAIDVVRSGLKVVGRQPFEASSLPAWFPSPRISCAWAEFGKLESVHAREIDQFMSIYTLLQRYLVADDWKRPLSIAVFGPPGSGKGFTIKQILHAARGGVDRKAIEFNAAQFTSTRDLAYAFRQAQDRNLAGETPLVIFDEFDCSVGAAPVGWLKYFLMPMQDGKFQDDVATYEVGRAIFVFSGGTTHSFQEFARKATQDPAFVSAKAPDFISRLRGHLDISGLGSSGLVDEVLMFRRAVVLRSLLSVMPGSPIDKYTDRANIDDDVVRAFLKTKAFQHGVRSMEAILEMANAGPRNGIHKETVPSKEQLEMHADATEFLGFMTGQL